MSRKKGLKRKFSPPAKYGRKVGNVWERKVVRSKHRFWQYNGYSFGVWIASQDIETIRIIETDTGEIYECSMSDFIGKAIRVTRPYNQYVMPVDAMRLVS